MPPSTKRPWADLHFDPGARRAAAIDRLGILRDETLVSPLLHDSPGGESVIWQTTGGVDHLSPGNFVLEHLATAVE